MTMVSGNLKASNSRDGVLAAAVNVIARDGILALTIDAVAKEAKLSKGGVLYHFASKDAMLRGMLEHFLTVFEQRISEEEAADPEPTGRWMRSYLTAFFSAPTGVAAQLGPTEQQNLHVALFTSIMIHRDLLAAVAKRFYERWKPAADADGIPPLEQAITWLAADGLGVWQMLGLLSPQSKEHQHLLAALKDRTRPHGLPSEPST